MDQSLTGLQVTEKPNWADDGSLRQLIQGPVPGILLTLVHNLERMDRSNFQAERETQAIIYARFVREIDPGTRSQVLQSVVSSIRMCAIAPEALLTFIENDSSAELVMDATHQYLMLGPTQLNEPMRSLSDLLPMLSDPRIPHKGLILAALITFGDRRVCAALRPYQEDATLKTCQQMASSIRIKALHRCSIEYLLSWLTDLVRESLTKPAREDEFSTLARALTNMVSQGWEQPVEDRLFHFGHHAFPSYEESLSTPYDSFILELEPLLSALDEFNFPAVSALIDYMRNPAASAEERRAAVPRRIRSDRRGNDRRVVSIAPAIERRAENRRTLNRRQESRR